MSLETLRELCVAMRILEDRKEALELQLKEINGGLDELRMKNIPEMMDGLGVKNATFEGIGRVQLTADIFASTREGQKEKAMQWLRDCGYDGMISETYNASSLKALFRRQLKEGIEIPDSIFNVSPFVRASIVKS